MAMASPDFIAGFAASAALGLALLAPAGARAQAAAPDTARELATLAATLNRCGTGLTFRPEGNKLVSQMRPDQWKNFRLIAAQDMALAQRVFGPLAVRFQPTGQLAVENGADYTRATAGPFMDCASYRGLNEAMGGVGLAAVQAVVAAAPVAVAAAGDSGPGPVLAPANPRTTAPAPTPAPAPLPALMPTPPPTSANPYGMATTLPAPVPKTAPPPAPAPAPVATADDRATKTLNALSRTGLSFERVDGKVVARLTPQEAAAVGAALDAMSEKDRRELLGVAQFRLSEARQLEFSNADQVTGNAFQLLRFTAGTQDGRLKRFVEHALGRDGTAAPR